VCGLEFDPPCCRGTLRYPSFMYVSMYVCMHVCVCVCMYVCMHVCVCVCVCVCVYIYIYIHTHTHTYTHTHIHKRLCTPSNLTFVHFTSRNPCTVMRRLTKGIRSEKCVVRRFRRCANITQCTCTNPDSIAYYTHMLYVKAYCYHATNLYSMLLH